MLFPPPSTVASADETTAFILLCWQELFHDDTPDTFRPRLLNLPGLVCELRDVAALATTSAAWDKHLTEVQDELRITVANHRSLLVGSPKYAWELEHLAKRATAKDIHIHANLLIESENSNSFYCQPLKDALRGMPKGKAALETAIGNLATFAARSDRPAGALLNIISDDSFVKSPEEAIDFLWTGSSGTPAEFAFVTSILGDSSDINAVIRSAPGLRLYSRREKPSGVEAEEYFTRNAGSAFVYGSVQTSDSTAAAKHALRTVGAVIDTFNLFNNRIVLSLKPMVLSWRLPDGKAQRIDVNVASLERLRPRHDARSLTQETVQALMFSRLQGRLLNAIELHALAHSSFASRVRVVNLWSAIECLLPVSGVGSIVERVVNLVAPIVVARRVSKIVKYLAISVHQYRNRYGLKLNYADGFQNSDRPRIEAADLLHVLAQPDGHPHPKSLVTFAGQHVLLRYRLFRAWQMISDPKMLANEIEESHQRVRWQLYRIYRARNLTVHHGEDIPLVSPMLGSLQYYFSVTLTRILREMVKTAALDVEHAVAQIIRDDEYTRHLLTTEPSRLRTEDFLHSAQSRRGEHLWH